MKNMNKEGRSGKTAVKLWSRPVLAACGLILCVALIASFSLAWYVGSAGSKDNKIMTSTFVMEAAIKDASGNTVQLTTQESGEKTAKLAGGATYTVDLGCSQKTNGHGYCTVTLGDQIYQTVTFGKCGISGCDKCGGREAVQFTVNVPAGEEWTIALASGWGVKPLDAGAEQITANAVIPRSGN